MIIIATGRPVRFFILLMGGWTIVRVASNLLAPSTRPMSPPPLTSAPPSLAQAHDTALPVLAAETRNRIETPAKSQTPQQFVAGVIMTPILQLRDAVSRSGPTAMKASAFVAEENDPPQISASKSIPSTAAISPVPFAPAAQSRSRRLRGSGWAFWREGDATPANSSTAGRLGGSQAGLRIDYDLTPDAPGRAAAYGRVSTAMNRPASPEAALGIAWQLIRAVPLSIAAERRIALGQGARDANALLVVGGFGPTPVMSDVEAEAYAQAGAVGYRSRDFFVDGKFSLMKSLPHAPLRLGASISGGAQPRVERLDIGPEAQIRLPLPRLAARFSVEWRERIAGRAAPASGVTVTLGADF